MTTDTPDPERIVARGPLYMADTRPELSAAPPWLLDKKALIGIAAVEEVTDVKIGSEAVAVLLWWLDYQALRAAAATPLPDDPHAEGRRVLDMPMRRNDAKAATVRDFLIALVDKLCDEGDMMSSKRPFGNSGWEWDLWLDIAANLQGRALPGGEYDEETPDWEAWEEWAGTITNDREWYREPKRLVAAAIAAMGATR